MKKVVLTSFGNCIPNPGPGGWASILRYEEHCREISGNELTATNLRMELRAMVEALKGLKEPCRVTARTRSEYVRDGIATWLDRWKANNWLHSVKPQGQLPIRHKDLWEEADRLRGKHQILCELIPNNVSDRDHDRCVSMANVAIATVPGIVAGVSD
jgi:ribonuclease HI